jgi:hypothetical protein
MKPRAQRVVTPAEAMQAAVTVFDEPVKVDALVGTWRKWQVGGFVLRIDSVCGAHDRCLCVAWIGGQRGNHWGVEDMTKCPLATPHEVLTAFVSTLPEEQRARVSLYPNVGYDGGVDVIVKDGTPNDSLRMVSTIEGVDACLTWLRAELANPVASKPEPRLTPTIVEGLERRIAKLEAANDKLARERDAFRESLRVSEDDCERLHVRLNWLVGEQKAVTEGSGER